MQALRARAVTLVVATTMLVLGGVGPAGASSPADLDEGSLVLYDRSSGETSLMTVQEDRSLVRTWTGTYGTGYTHLVGGNSSVEDGPPRQEGGLADRLYLYDAVRGAYAVVEARGHGNRPRLAASGKASLGMESVLHTGSDMLFLDQDTGRWVMRQVFISTAGLGNSPRQGLIAPGYRAVQAGAVTLLHAADGRWAVARAGFTLSPTGVKGRFAVGYEEALVVEADGVPATDEVLLYSTDDARWAVVQVTFVGMEVLDHGSLPVTRQVPFRLLGLGPLSQTDGFGAQTSGTTARRHFVAPGPDVTTGNALFLPQRVTGAAWISHVAPAPCEYC